MITERASKSFDFDTLVKPNYQPWYDHWFATAEAFRAEVAAEGLVNTVKAIEAEIEFQRKFQRTGLFDNKD
jgi:hypothetical protein